MSRRKSVKKPAGPNKISDQILSQDYWEGFYALSDHGIVRVEDTDGTNASYEVYALLTGESVSTGTFPFTETTTFGELAGHIAKETGRNVTLRISDAAMNPDRHEEIRRILETGDRFQLARVQNLIRRIRSRGICLLGGRMGGRLIEDGEYEGFYLLEDGGVLYCREAREWDETSMPGVVDGAVSYFILHPERFDLGAAREEFYGFLLGDRFSDLATHLSSHGRVVSELAVRGTELFDHLMGALNGNADSAAVASHHLRMNLCIRS